MRSNLAQKTRSSFNVTLVPFIAAAGELKNQAHPAQRKRNARHRYPARHFAVPQRPSHPLRLKKKIALFCNVAESCVISMEDVDTIYAVPVELGREGLDAQILRLLKLEHHPQDLQPWMNLVHRLHHPVGEVRIAVVGKYVQLEDAYKSLREALLHGA